MKFNSRSFILGGLAVVAGVRAQAASDLDLATVEQQFKNSHIVPDVLATFTPSGLVTVKYGSVLPVGQDLPATDVASQPTIAIQGTASAVAAPNGPFNVTVTTTKYTVLLMDGNYAGSTNPDGYNLHYLQNDFTGTSNNDVIPLAGTTTARVPYAGPGPAAGSGPHRYIALVFAQPDNFTPPATPPQNPGVKLFSLTDYMTAARLDAPIAGTYFTVTNGAVTVSVEPTSSVDPKTLSVSSASPTKSQSTAASPTTSKSAAGRKSVVGAAGVVGAVGAVVAFLA